MERESFIIFPQESRDGYLVGLALAEAVHEEDLRREQEGLRIKTAAERDGAKGVLCADLVEEVDGEAAAAVGGEEEDVVLQRQPRPLGRRWFRHGRLLPRSLVQACWAPVPVGRSGRWGLERRRGQHRHTTVVLKVAVAGQHARQSQVPARSARSRLICLPYRLVELVALGGFFETKGKSLAFFISIIKKKVPNLLAKNRIKTIDNIMGPRPHDTTGPSLRPKNKLEKHHSDKTRQPFIIVREKTP
jgi:hypothetical protein